MKEQDKYAVWISLALGPVLGGFLAYFVAASVLQEFSWCIAGEENCVRDWFSAFSGYIAAAGALIAAAVTLPHLRRQADEARKQTRYLAGEDDPTIDVVKHLKDESILVIRIVNWNRRSIFLLDSRVTSKRHHDSPDAVTAIWDAKTSAGEVANAFPIHLNGWEDRSARPDFAQLHLLLLRPKQGTEAAAVSDEAIPFPDDAAVTVKIRMLGEVHRMFEKTAQAFPTS